MPRLPGTDDAVSHGGEVDIAAEHYGIPRDRWLDLSTGINPTPYPLPELAREYWYRLPEAGLYSWLREIAATYYGAVDPALVVPTPGSQAAIQWLPRLLPTMRVAILSPTYTEHAVCWSAAGHLITEVAAVDAIPSDAAAVIVANPNNPDGRILAPDVLLRASEGRWLIVDEAYADLTPDTSLAAMAERPGVIVLRSVGKFFGLAGMRLGFAITGPQLASSLNRALGPWAVSGPAAAVGAVALADDAWIRSTRIRLTAAAGKLDGILMRTGLRLLGGTALFRLVECPKANELYEHLARLGILVRHFPDRLDWLRFGIPGDDQSFERLAHGLATWRSRTPTPAASGSRQRASGAWPRGSTAG